MTTTAKQERDALSLAKQHWFNVPDYHCVIEQAQASAERIERKDNKDWAFSEIAIAQAIAQIEAGDIAEALTIANGIEDELYKADMFREIASVQA